MENKKTLKEKLWGKGKYFIPFYGGIKVICDGKTAKARLGLVNMLYSAVLGAALVVYSIQAHGVGSFDPKKVWEYSKVGAIVGRHEGYQTTIGEKIREYASKSKRLENEAEADFKLRLLKKIRQEYAQRTNQQKIDTSREDTSVYTYVLMAGLMACLAYSRYRLYKRASSQSKKLENEVEKS